MNASDGTATVPNVRMRFCLPSVFEELLLSRDIAAVALGEHVFFSAL